MWGNIHKCYIEIYRFNLIDMLHVGLNQCDTIELSDI
uniref:Uncharacterized protein n=1 Tax=Anguilla anguilla TaxID=7936 RepID=A0A0E9SFC6_ANGAN